MAQSPPSTLWLSMDWTTTHLVDRILHAKTADPTADTRTEEAEIDRLVYALYGLTPAEIAAVEGR